MLAKPLTYMNDSGRRGPQAPRRASARRWPSCWSSRTTSRCRSASCGSARPGSHGGHNGLRSIIDELGTEKFSRLRVGIGEPGRGAVDHVLAGSIRRRDARLPSCSTRRPTRSRRGPARGPRRRPTGSTASSSRRRPRRGRAAARRGRRARPTSTASGGRETGWRRVLPAAATRTMTRHGGDVRPVPWPASAGSPTRSRGSGPSDGPPPRRRSESRPRPRVGRGRGGAARSGSAAAGDGDGPTRPAPCPRRPVAASSAATGAGSAGRASGARPRPRCRRCSRDRHVRPPARAAGPAGGHAGRTAGTPA